MTGSMCDFSIQHYACLPQVALSNFCTLCTDTIHVKLFDFIILSVISGIQTQSRAAVTAHRVQAFWQRELPQRNVEAVLHQILCKSWRCSSNPFQHGKDVLISKALFDSDTHLQVNRQNVRMFVAV